jgi:hypothetical protein
MATKMNTIGNNQKATNVSNAKRPFTIGFIGAFKDEFIENIRVAKIKRTRAVRWIEDDICLESLQTFIFDYNISELYIEAYITIEGSHITKHESILKKINKSTNCTIIYLTYID